MPHTSEAATQRIGWFTHDRFGLFIHWGIYALAACDAWVRHDDRSDDETYARYFRCFYPDLYDPDDWAAEAANAGMKYVVITAKHHDGFCLWDSALTDLKATRTPWGRDLLRPLVEAFRAKGLRIGFYYSLLDWRHPDFPIDALHPQRDDIAYREAQAGRDIRKYAEYLRGQTRELLTQFGPVAILWYDFSYKHMELSWGEGKGRDEWESEDLLALIRELQPDTLVNDRLDLPGDFVTPEEYQPRDWVAAGGQRVAWETCQTMDGAWGYRRDANEWRPVEALVRALVDTVSKGGNLLLNIGPNGRGAFDPRHIERLRGIGEWLRLHGRAIYGCGASDFVPPPDCRYTYNPAANRLYLHLFAWPYRHVHLPGLGGRVAYAQLLHDASYLKSYVIAPDQPAQYMNQAGDRPDTLTLELPVQRPPVAVPVIELFLTEPEPSGSRVDHGSDSKAT